MNIFVENALNLGLYKGSAGRCEIAFIFKYVILLKKNSFVCLRFKIIGLSLCVNFASRNRLICQTASADVAICG